MEKNITKEDVIKAEKNLMKINAKRRMMFVPDKRSVPSGKIDIVDISDFIS
jgi:hypothetical protein